MSLVCDAFMQAAGPPVSWSAVCSVGGRGRAPDSLVGPRRGTVVPVPVPCVLLSYLEKPSEGGRRALRRAMQVLSLSKPPHIHESAELRHVPFFISNLTDDWVLTKIMFQSVPHTSKAPAWKRATAAGAAACHPANAA
jgi:hypothetical protein